MNHKGRRIRNARLHNQIDIIVFYCDWFKCFPYYEYLLNSQRKGGEI